MNLHPARTGNLERMISVGMILATPVAAWLASPIGIPLAVLGWGWWSLRKCVEWWADVARSLLKPTFAGLAIACVLLAVANTFQRTIDPLQLHEFEVALVITRLWFVELTTPFLDWSLPILILITVATWVVPRLRLVSKFVLVQSMVQTFHLGLLVATSFTLFSNAALGNLCQRVHQKSLYVRSNQIAKYQSQLRETSEKVGQLLAAQIVTNAMARLSPSSLAAYRDLFQSITTKSITEPIPYPDPVRGPSTARLRDDKYRQQSVASTAQELAKLVAIDHVQHGISSPETKADSPIISSLSKTVDSMMSASSLLEQMPETRTEWTKQRESLTELSRDVQTRTEDLRLQKLRCTQANAAIVTMAAHHLGAVVPLPNIHEIAEEWIRATIEGTSEHVLERAINAGLRAEDIERGNLSSLECESCKAVLEKIIAYPTGIPDGIPGAPIEAKELHSRIERGINKAHDTIKQNAISNVRRLPTEKVQPGERLGEEIRRQGIDSVAKERIRGR
ncbi:MAG: hypothetical protein JNK85_29915 [Verrucomicrobiales bacterium]|nr:hypothetical protein [Verrucomicrobiales bacterium]